MVLKYIYINILLSKEKLTYMTLIDMEMDQQNLIGNGNDFSTQWNIFKQFQQTVYGRDRYLWKIVYRLKNKMFTMTT